MKDTPRDYTNLTAIAEYCGMTPYKDRFGILQPGEYSFKGLRAPVDLSACAEDEKSILRTAVEQLSQQIEDAYYEACERDSRS